MRVLITGATGWIGHGLVSALSQAGHDLVIISRSPEQAREQIGFRVLALDWKSPLPSVDAVIHLAGEPVVNKRWSKKRKEILERSRVDQTAHLVQSIKAMKGEKPRRFLSASAIGYYGNRENEILNESSPAGEGFLADLCQNWEKQAREAENLGIETCCVRIGVVLGSGGGALAKIQPLFKMGLGGRLGSGRQWMSWVHYQDLIQLFLWLLETPQLPKVVNGTAPGAVTNLEFTKTLSGVLGRPAFFAVPGFVLRFALGELSSALLEGQRVSPEALLKQGFTFRYSELKRALTEAT